MLLFLKMEMAKLNDEINMKNQQISSLEKQMATSFSAFQKRTQNKTDDAMEFSQVMDQSEMGNPACFHYDSII